MAIQLLARIRRALRRRGAAEGLRRGADALRPRPAGRAGPGRRSTVRRFLPSSGRTAPARCRPRSPSSGSGSSTDLEPGSPAYNIPTAVRLDGRLDINVLRRALERSRSAATRSSGQRSPRRAASCGWSSRVRSKLALPVEDLSGLSPRPSPVARHGAHAGGGGAPLRPGPRAARPRRAHPPRRRPPHRPGDDAPHRLRRLVARRPDPRGLGALRRLPPRRALASARAAPSSTPTSPPGSATGCGASVLDQQLDYWTGQLDGARHAGAADRPAPAGGLERPRRRVAPRRFPPRCSTPCGRWAARREPRCT